MWSELPIERKEEYKQMMLAFASLTELFAQKSDMTNGSLIPILNSKYQEAMFQKVFSATAEDNGNTSYDASLKMGTKKYLIGIKTFQYNNNDQKIAQFKAKHNDWAGEIDIMAANSFDEDKGRKTQSEINEINHECYLSLAKKIAIIRNQRISSSIANLQGFNVSEEDDCESVYHVLMTANIEGKPTIIVGETSYDMIDIDNIEVLGCTSASNPTNFYFQDKNHRYKYTSADSQLSMNFRNKDIKVDEWTVLYAKDAYQIFSEIATKIYSVADDRKTPEALPSAKKIVESHCWSLLNEEGEVELFSGLNSFYGVGSRISKDKRVKTVNDFITKFSYVFSDESTKESFRNRLAVFLCDKAGSKEEKYEKAVLREQILKDSETFGNPEFLSKISRLMFRPMNEAYIPIPSSRLFHEKHPDFFVSSNITFNEKGGITATKDDRLFQLVFEPSGDVVNAFIGQDWGKGIETDEKMGKLGEWVLRRVFQLTEYEPLTATKLNNIGINGIRLYKMQNSEAVHFEFVWIDLENPPYDYWS